MKIISLDILSHLWPYKSTSSLPPLCKSNLRLICRPSLHVWLNKHYSPMEVNGRIRHISGSYKIKSFQLKIKILNNEEWRYVYLTNHYLFIWVIDVGNKGEILPDFSLEITSYDFTKRDGRDEAWTKSLSWDKSCHLRYIRCS